MNEPYYKYLEWYLRKLVANYNKYTTERTDENLKTIHQVCREYNADCKLTHENRRENYFLRAEVVDRNPVNLKLYFELAVI